jgi:uncharacterized membrane protein YeiB
VRVLVGVVAAYLVTLAAERLFDLGVVAALVFGVGALAWGVVQASRLRPDPGGRPAPHLTALAVLLPLLGLTHADPEWWRTTIVLYAAYGVIALVILRRKSAPAPPH